MSAHLPDETLVDIATGAAAAGLSHLEGCAPCAARVSKLREALALAARAEVPEPPPAYWEAFRRDLGRKIAQPPRRPVRWLWLAPAAAAAAALALTLVPARHPDEAPARPAAATLPSWSALPPIEEDAGVPVLEAVVASDDDAAALEEARGLGPFLASLSDEDSQALTDTLRRQNGGEL